MPSYDFKCDACDIRFQEITSYDEAGVYADVKCPDCGRSDKKTRLWVMCNFAFANPVGTDRWNSDAKGHDFRFKHNLPSVLNKRAQAEAASHMGGTSEIYGNNNDLNRSGPDPFGDVL